MPGNNEQAGLGQQQWNWGMGGLLGGTGASTLTTTPGGYYPATRTMRVSIPAPPLEAAETIIDEAGVKTVNEFLIGCDPEFVVMDNSGRVINVRDYVANGRIGYDHGGRVIELRPGPSKCAYTILRRLQKLIGDEKLSRFPVPNKFRAGGMVRTATSTESLGGHVHVDLDPQMRIAETEPGVYIYSPAHYDRMAALDHVTHRLEDLDILPKVECEQRRRDSGYGHWGAFRVAQSSPLKRRFEYRTMASWLYDPKVAYICLTAAKLASLDPSVAMGTLLKRTQYPFRRLQDWFQAFASKDSDAGRIFEKLLSKGHKHLLADPDADFREKWEMLPA